MAKQPKDIAASVRQRLLNLAREEGQVFDVVLVAFGLERLVCRLSVSDYRDRFVLKGGMLVTLWTADTGRFTRDIDFLAFGSDEETELKAAFSAILAIDGGDGLVYDTASLTAVAIREDQLYGGMRLRTDAYLGNTRIPITVDLGFGDALGDPRGDEATQDGRLQRAATSPKVATGANPRKCGGIPGDQGKSYKINGLVAEGVGFEPTDACTSAVFKTAAIDHSATLPGFGITVR